APARYLSWFDIFPPEQRRALNGDQRDDATAQTTQFENLFEAARQMGLDPVQRLQYVDFQTMLLDNLLMKADKISMAHSLEVRVTFLDRNLVEFGLALPPRAKIGPLRNKALMRSMLKPWLGARIARRPK